MLQKIRQNGMDDVEFIIVNSKIPLSQFMLPHLLNRVSFKVYQDTEKDQVWNALEGEKDDMFVYDRCGRLSYYIPFPLSIIHDKQPIVFTAVLDTYFRSPCGVTCDNKGSVSVDKYMEEIEEEDRNDTELESDENIKDDVHFHNPDNNKTNLRNSSFEDHSMIASNESTMQINLNEAITDDYNDFNEANNENSTIENSFFKKIFNFFWKYENRNNTGYETSNETSTSMMEYNLEFAPESNENLTLNESMNADANVTILEKQTPTPSGCAEADDQVCKNWSKKKLLHVQMCCAFNLEDSMENDGIFKRPDSCKRFGKKRCKKSQTILKCCLKTKLSEVSTEKTPEVNTVNSTEVNTDNSTEVNTDKAFEVNTDKTSEGNTDSTPDVSTDKTEMITVSTLAGHTVCCKEIENQKTCYVSETPECDQKEEKTENLK